jgi:hypothetical protein
VNPPVHKALHISTGTGSKYITDMLSFQGLLMSPLRLVWQEAALVSPLFIALSVSAATLLVSDLPYAEAVSDHYKLVHGSKPILSTMVWAIKHRWPVGCSVHRRCCSALLSGRKA